MTDNSDQRDFWSGPSGQSWVTFQAEQDAVLNGALEPIVARAGWQTGHRVLDIGCGTGALSLVAADTVGPAGHVLAVDISAPMIERAAERLAPFDHAHALLADAAEVAWPRGDFDLAISRFGVMFFVDPPKAFANIARALRPGGRMVFATWAPVRDNPYWYLAGKAASARLGELEKVPPNTPGPFGMADVDWSIGTLTSAGLSHVACDVVDIPLRHADGAKGLANLSLRIGPARRVVNHFGATDDDLRTIEADLTNAFDAWDVVGDGVPAKLNIYTATRL